MFYLVTERGQFSFDILSRYILECSICMYKLENNPSSRFADVRAREKEKKESCINGFIATGRYYAPHGPFLIATSVNRETRKGQRQIVFSTRHTAKYFNFKRDFDRNRCNIGFVSRENAVTERIQLSLLLFLIIVNGVIEKITSPKHFVTVGYYIL